MIGEVNLDSELDKQQKDIVLNSLLTYTHYHTKTIDFPSLISGYKYYI